MNKPPSKPNNLPRMAGENGQWGNLPPRLREDMLQQAQHQFLSDYAERLRAYYKLLGADE